MRTLAAHLRHLLSHLMPLTRRVPTAYSGTVEVTLYQGYKVLNTAHANYSYGSLQRVLRYGLQFTPSDPAGPVLVLGLGGGSVVQTLRQERGPATPITAVELDPTMIELAAEEFGIQSDASLRIICADAFRWLPTAPTAGFGLVVVDLFIDLTLPEEVSTTAFWADVWRVVQPGGAVLLNTLLQDPLRIAGQDAAAYLAELGFSVKELEVEANRLLVLGR